MGNRVARKEVARKEVKSYKINSLSPKNDRCKLYVVYTDRTEKCLGSFKTSRDAERRLYQHQAAYI